jgi:hypothetical protein
MDGWSLGHNSSQIRNAKSENATCAATRDGEKSCILYCFNQLDLNLTNILTILSKYFSKKHLTKYFLVSILP